MKLKMFYIFLFTLLISTNVFGQLHEREGEETTDTTISLITIIDDSIKVILLDKNGFIVETSLRIFKENLDNWLIENPHLNDDRKLLNLIIEQAYKDNIIDATEIAKKNNLISRLEYRTADLLENGQCIVLTSSIKTEIVAEIKIQTYSYYCGPLCGDGGRRFFVNGILLLEVMDWIS